MTWRTVTTCILECEEPLMGGPHTTYSRTVPGPVAGDIVQCPYCECPAVVKATTVTHRTYGGGLRG
jgi:hypothetical protein